LDFFAAILILPVFGLSVSGTRDHRECQQGHTYLSMPSDIQSILSDFCRFLRYFFVTFGPTDQMVHVTPLRPDVRQLFNGKEASAQWWGQRHGT
jgi:hypothetical protein